MLPFLLLPLLICVAQEPAPLRENLETARTYVLAGDGDAAYAAVVQIFETHEGNDEVLRHLPAIQDVLIDSLYLISQAEHKSAAGVEGVPDIPFHADITSYKEKTGQFKLRWEGETQLGDFSMVDGSLRFPVSLGRKFRLGFELSEYSEKTQIRFLIDNEKGQVFEIDCGLGATGLNRQVAKAYLVTDGKYELLDREDKKLPVPGKAVMMQVKGTGSGLAIYAGNKKYMSLKTGKDPIGYLTVEGLDADAFVGMEYDGPLDFEGMADMIEVIRIQSREGFRSKVDFKEHLPEWVHPHLSGTGFALDHMIPPGGKLDSDQEAAWQLTLDTIETTRIDGLPVLLLSWLQDSPPEHLPEVLRQFASLRAAYEGGYWGFARGHANNVLQIESNHAPTKHMLIESLALEGYGDNAWNTAVGFYKANPEDAGFVIQAALLLMRINMEDDLKYFLEQDEDLPDTLKSRCFDLLKHREAPRGNGMRTETGAHIELTSNLPRDEVEALASWLAREISRAKAFLPEGTLKKEDNLRVFLFADRWDYEEFSTDFMVSAHPSAAGFYSQELDAVIAWANPNEEDLKSSLRREAMIQIGKRIHPEYPVWACIGLSEIVGDGRIVPGRRLKTLSNRAARMVRLAKKEELVPFALMLHMSDPVFYALETERNMEVQAWLMMVILTLDGQESEVDIMDALIEGPRSGKTWAETVDAVYVLAGGSGVFEGYYKRFVKQISALEVQ